MDFIKEFLFGDGIAHSIFALAVVIAIGTLLGRIKIGGIAFGATWILFIGIVASYFGMTLNLDTLNFIRDLGLILFVFAIGLQIGPTFFASLRQEGAVQVWLSVLAMLLSAVLAYILFVCTDIPIQTVVGVMNGSVGNTPAVGAAQQTYYDITGVYDNSIPLGYAITFPVGMVAVIIAFILLRAILRIDITKEQQQSLTNVASTVENAEKQIDNKNEGCKKSSKPNIFTLFFGIAIGVFVGSIPLIETPQPIRLGMAAGSMFVAILIGHFGKRWNIVTNTTLSVNLMLRDIGLAMFLAAIGLASGSGFIEAVVNGGYLWLAYSIIIAIVPLLVVGIYARLRFKMNFFTIMGMLSGCMTNSVALNYANSLSGNDIASVSYAMIYPLAVLLRVIIAQAMILIFV